MIFHYYGISSPMCQGFANLWDEPSGPPGEVNALDPEDVRELWWLPGLLLAAALSTVIVLALCFLCCALRRSARPRRPPPARVDRTSRPSAGASDSARLPSSSQPHVPNCVLWSWSSLPPAPVPLPRETQLMAIAEPVDQGHSIITLRGFPMFTAGFTYFRKFYSTMDWSKYNWMSYRYT